MKKMKKMKKKILKMIKKQILKMIKKNFIFLMQIVVVIIIEWLKSKS